MLIVSPYKTVINPAYKKLIQARQSNQTASYDIFPLCTQKEGFGVISILKIRSPESDWEIEIVNDRFQLECLLLIQARQI
ncbi:hypothetical protein J3E68DRAFT_415866 [Trichoderma sp. SZMC 28012]